MGSHLWPFQKWCRLNPELIDRECARDFVDSCLSLGNAEAHQMENGLVHLLAGLRNAVEPSDYDKDVAAEFVTSCYGEFLEHVADAEDQLACLVGAVRRGQPLLPRDGLYGGAYDTNGCGTCGRSFDELVKGGHGDEPHPEFEALQPEELGSWWSELRAEFRAKVERETAAAVADQIDALIRERFRPPVDRDEAERWLAFRRLARELRELRERTKLRPGTCPAPSRASR